MPYSPPHNRHSFCCIILFMDYTLKRSTRIKSVKISLNDAGGVVVSAPWYMPKFVIEGFVNQSSEWIERQQARMKLKKQAYPILSWEDGLLSYLGKLYTITFVAEAREKVQFSDGKCLVHPITGLESDMRKTLLSWLKQYATIYIVNRVDTWAKEMKLSYGTVRFGQQSSRWGSCSGNNNLRFNWRLIHFSPEVIDYVVIHELAHTKHHNHSQRFWNLVETYCPSWKKQRSFLHHQSVMLEK
jgi:predicted metal-dependent hydrolase